MTHILCPSCGAALEVLEPDRVVAYLRRKGWTERASQHYRPDGWKHMQRFEGDPDYLEIPMMREWRDYPRRFFELLNNLRALESRPASVILDDMRHGEHWDGPLDGATARRLTEEGKEAAARYAKRTRGMTKRPE